MFILNLLRSLYRSNLEPKVKFQLYYLQILMVIQSACEILGILSLLPFLGIILTKEKFNFEFLSFLDLNEKNYIILFSIVLITINWFTYLIGKKIFIFSENLSKHFSELQIENYLNSTLKSHSSNLINNISIETYRFTRMVLIPSLLLISKITNIIFISIFLLAYSFIPTLAIICSLIIIIITVYFLNKNRIKSIGDEITLNNKKRIHTLTEIVNNLPSIRIYKLEKLFLNLFSKNNKRYANSMAQNQYLILSQRYLVEGIIIVCVILSIYFISSQFNIQNYLTDVAIYIYAFYRIAPHLQSSLNLFSQAKSHSQSGVDLINMIMSEKKVQKNIIMSQEKFVSLKLDNFTYSHGDNIIFRNTSLSIEKGDKILLTGESGVGKSTLLNLIFGTIKFDNIEKILINSKAYKNEQIRILNNYIGYVPQELMLFDESLYFNITFKNQIDENDEFFKKILDISFLTEDLFHDGEDLNLFTKKISEKGSNLSIGQKQRISLARALYKKPQILILDETFNSIDYGKRNKILNYLNNLENLTIIIVSHHKLEKLDFSKIININNKKINKSKI